MVEPIQAKNGTFVVIDLRNWPNSGGTTGKPAASRLIAELPGAGVYGFLTTLNNTPTNFLDLTIYGLGALLAFIGGLLFYLSEK